MFHGTRFVLRGTDSHEISREKYEVRVWAQVAPEAEKVSRMPRRVYAPLARFAGVRAAGKSMRPRKNVLVVGAPAAIESRLRVVLESRGKYRVRCVPQSPLASL